MAGFLRGKQAGVQRDLSAGLEPELFAIDEVHMSLRYP
jgi:syntaxin-binding protein 5